MPVGEHMLVRTRAKVDSRGGERERERERERDISFMLCGVTLGSVQLSSFGGLVVV